MSDEEVAIAVREAKMRGKRVAAHARSCESVKQCVRHGIEIIYHASFTDEEALDMLEANRDRHFVAPGIGILVAMLDHAAPWGITRQKAVEMGYEVELAAARGVAPEDAQARHPRAARRRLRLRLHPARRERPRPRVLREVPRDDADGGARCRPPATAARS